MPYLVDTNIFIRLASRNDPKRQLTLDALTKLRSRNEILCYTPQIVSEFWTVCTRPPAELGGLGLSAEQTERKVRVIERYFVLLPDSEATFREWRNLVASQALLGVAVHDAKVVASMHVHGVRNLLTDDAGFKRYTSISVVSPTEL